MYDRLRRDLIDVKPVPIQESVDYGLELPKTVNSPKLAGINKIQARGGDSWSCNTLRPQMREFARMNKNSRVLRLDCSASSVPTARSQNTFTE